MFSSIKETIWLINKGICVLLFDVFQHLQLKKTDVLKACWKILALLRPAVFRLQKRVSHFKLFCSGDKRVLLEFLRK